jgi:hypothetical protein
VACEIAASLIVVDSKGEAATRFVTSSGLSRYRNYLTGCFFQCRRQEALSIRQANYRISIGTYLTVYIELMSLLDGSQESTGTVRLV